MNTPQTAQQINAEQLGYVLVPRKSEGTSLPQSFCIPNPDPAITKLQEDNKILLRAVKSILGILEADFHWKGSVETVQAIRLIKLPED